MRPANISLIVLVSAILVLSVFSVNAHSLNSDPVKILNDLNVWLDGVHEYVVNHGDRKMYLSTKDQFAKLKAGLGHWRCKINSVVKSWENCRFIDEELNYRDQQIRKDVEKVQEVMWELISHYLLPETTVDDAKEINEELKSYARNGRALPQGGITPRDSLQHQRDFMKVENKDHIKRGKKGCKEMVHDRHRDLVEILILLKRADETIYKILIIDY